MIRWLVEHATTVVLAVMAIALFGALSYITLPRESSPDITIPVVLVTTPYPGVSPADVEGLISIPMERELAGLQDVKKLSSTSAEGASIVSIEFEPDIVIEDALQKVRDRVNRAKVDLPSDAEEPQVREIAFSDMPIAIVTIAGPVDPETLKQLGEDLKDEVARIPGVLDTKLAGGLERQVRVQIDPQRLAYYGLAMHDITGAIGDENVNIPGGTLKVNDGNFLVRVPAEIGAARELEDVAIKRVGDQPVFIRDVGRVVWGFENRTSYARMNGRPAVSLTVSKRPGENIIYIVDDVRELVEAQSKTWPEGVTYEVLSDQSKAIRNMVSELQNNIITALILVLLVLLVSMGLRSSFFVALSVPLSMLVSFMVLDLLGYTLNMIVLFALILALGMLVDNAIVIVENIYRHLEEGKTPIEASIDGTNEVAIAVAASTATTVAAFFPLVFWGGIMGEFMGFLPKTIIIVLVASLFVAVGILPVFTSRILSPSKNPHVTDELAEVPTNNMLTRAYKAVLEASIRWRYATLALGGLVFVGTVLIFGVFNHGTEFFPDSDPNRAIIGVRMAEGTDLETTDRVTRQIEAVLSTEANIDVWVAETGVSAGGSNLVGAQGAPNQAKITVDFLPAPNDAGPDDQLRLEATPLTVDRLRRRLSSIPGAEISIEKEAMGPPVGKPIGVLVSGEDYDDVGRYAQKLRRELLANVDGIAELKDDYVTGRPELRLRIDRGAAKRVGVSSALVGNTVRTAVNGATASTLRDGDDEYDIVVEAAPEFREDIQSILNLRVPGRTDKSPDTFPVPLSTVASYELSGGAGSIRHEDQDLVITLEGEVVEGANANEVKNAVAAFVASAEPPKGIVLEMGGNEKEQQDSMAFLGKAFLIAVVLITMVLVTQFDSVALPAIIMMTVVLSLVGVLWGLLITGTPFGIIMTGIGVISLAGVVVNNAIVLLDYVEQLRARGLPVHDALVRAGLTRFRPVMLTAVTTVLGLVPMALGISIDFGSMRILTGGSSAQFWGPMAIAVIFGLSFATILTLVMVPTLYSIYDDIQGLGRRVKSAVTQRSTPVDAATSPSGTPATAKLWWLALPLAIWAAPTAEAITLDDAVRAAAENNVDLQILTEQTFQAEVRKGQAWGTLGPRISGNATYVLNQREVELDMGAAFADLPFEIPEGDPIVVQKKTFVQGGYQIDQPLFSSSALPLLRGAYKNADAAKLDELAQAAQIRAGVARSYWGLVAARQSIALSEQAIGLSKSQLEFATRQVNAGIADQRAVLQARLGVSRAERDLLTAKERLVGAEETFETLTGLDASVPLDAPEVGDLPGSLDEALETARRERPDLLAAQLRQEVASLQTTVSHLGWVPRVDGRFAHNYSQNNGFNPEKWNWTLSVTASWTLWDGGQRLTEERTAMSNKRIADLSAEKSARSAEEDVANAWIAYERAQLSYGTVTEELELQRENLRLSQLAFSGGTATWLEVEQAELGLTSTRLTELTERMNRDLAAVQLRLAVGQW